MVLGRYSYLNNALVNDSKVEIVEAPKPLTIILENTSKDMTANHIAKQKAVFIAQRVSEYKRKSTSILLIPDVHVPLEKLLFDREELINCTLTL